MHTERRSSRVLKWRITGRRPVVVDVIHLFLHAMRPRFSIYSLLWLALFAALASVFYVNYLWQAKALADVVMSARLLPQGNKITSEDVQLARVPIDNVPEGTATSLSKVLGNHIRNGYTKNHPIYLDNLYEIRVTTNYNWHDDSRIHLVKTFGTWRGRAPVAGKGVVLGIRYSTFHVGSFDGGSSIDIDIQLPDKLTVGDEHDIRIVSNERTSRSLDQDNGSQTIPLEDCEVMVSRFANPMIVENKLDDGDTAGTVKIMEIGDTYAKIELILEPQLRFVGHAQYGLPTEITLVRQTKKDGG